MRFYKQSLLTFFYVCSIVGNPIIEKPIVAMVCTYNNAKYCRMNLESIALQQYSNYRIFIVDDCSTDQNIANIEQALQDFNLTGRTTFIKNKKNRKSPHNFYTSITQIPDESIVVVIDGDDRLSHRDVFSYLNKTYTNDDIWLTYGNAVTMQTNKGFSWSLPFEKIDIETNNFRNARYTAVTHLRTFYAWLYKEIYLQDLFYEGAFFKQASDVSMYLPMIEMAQNRHKFISRTMYVYNDLNPINCHKVIPGMQLILNDYVRALPPYTRLPMNCCGKYTDLFANPPKVSCSKTLIDSPLFKKNKEILIIPSPEQKDQDLQPNFELFVDDTLIEQPIDLGYFTKYLELTHLNTLSIIPQDQLPNNAFEVAPQVYAYQLPEKLDSTLGNNIIARKNNPSKRTLMFEKKLILLGTIEA